MSTQNASILVVDDDRDLRELLHQYLSRENFDVFCASGAEEMNAQLQAQSFNTIILDLMMPEEDGLSILRRIRPSTPSPIIILSAKGQDMDRIIGLEVGADDYLSKPFNPRELLARIRALLRRTQPTANDSAYTVHFGQNHFNTKNNVLMQNNREIKLTDSETLMLQLFIEHSNEVLSRDSLIDALHGRDRDPFDRSIDIHITRLRKKLEENPTFPRHIRTVWAKGYKFTPDNNN